MAVTDLNALIQQALNLSAEGGVAADDAATAAAKAGYRARKAAGLGAALAPAAATVEPIAAAAPTGVRALATGAASAAKAAGSKLGTGLGILARGAGLLQAGKGAFDLAAEGPSSSSVDNMFQGAATLVSPAAGLAGNALTAGRNVALEYALGKLGLLNDKSPLVKSQAEIDALTNAPGAPEADLSHTTGSIGPNEGNPVGLPATPARPAVEALSNPAEIAHANAILNSNGPVEPGTGFIRNNSTGAVTAINKQPKSFGASLAGDNGMVGPMLNVPALLALANTSNQTRSANAATLQAGKNATEIFKAQLESLKGQQKVEQVPNLKTGSVDLVNVNPYTGTAQKLDITSKPKALGQADFEAVVKRDGVTKLKAKEILAQRGYDVSNLK